MRRDVLDFEQRKLHAEIIVFALLLGAYVGSIVAQGTHQIYWKEAENAAMLGKCAVATDIASGGLTVWLRGGEIKWNTVVKQGTYKFLGRVRAGGRDNHTSGVTGKTQYLFSIDGIEKPLTLIEGTVVYHGDERNYAWIESEPLALETGFHDIAFKAKWRWAKCDIMVLTTVLSYVPPKNPPYGQEVPLNLALVPDLETRRRLSGYTLWTKPLELNVEPDEKPESVRDIDKLTITASINEFEPTNFIVTNWLDAPLRFRITVSDLQSEEGVRIANEKIEVRFAEFIESWEERLLADALPLANQACILTVPPGESRQVWLIVDCHDAAPSDYRGRITVMPLESFADIAPKSIELELKIWNIIFPNIHPLKIFLSDYDVNFPGMVKDMTEHYVNVFHVSNMPGPGGNYAAQDEQIRREGKHGMIYFETWAFRDSDEWKTPAGREKFKKWMADWSTHLREELGLNYKDYCLHIYDEQSGSTVDDYIAARQLIQEVDPNIKDIVTASPATTLDELKRMNPYVDIWSPFLPTLEDETKVEFYRNTGKPVWPYICAEDKKERDIYSYYRLFLWRVWEYGFHGCFVWTYIRDNAWRSRFWDGGMVYPGQYGVIPSRRWEMFREGLDDYLYLYLLQQMVQKAEKVGGNVETAKQVLEEAPSRVLNEPTDINKALSWRYQIAQQIVKLCNSLENQ